MRHARKNPLPPAPLRPRTKAKTAEGLARAFLRGGGSPLRLTWGAVRVAREVIAELGRHDLLVDDRPLEWLELATRVALGEQSQALDEALDEANTQAWFFGDPQRDTDAPLRGLNDAQRLAVRWTVSAALHAVRTARDAMAGEWSELTLSQMEDNAARPVNDGSNVFMALYGRSSAAQARARLTELFADALWSPEQPEVRHNPLPPPVRVAEHVSRPKRLVEEALRASEDSPRRVVWAVARVVEAVYRVYEARGLLVDDRLEGALAEVRRWCLQEDFDPFYLKRAGLRLKMAETIALTTQANEPSTRLLTAAKKLAVVAVRYARLEAGEGVPGDEELTGESLALALGSAEQAWASIERDPEGVRARVAGMLRASLEGRS